ncbi:MAG: glycosyltransferase family 4 protein [Rhizomicrobium sp.]|jgi:glycosyltransferase involved in cell wall biosynthesis
MGSACIALCHIASSKTGWPFRRRSGYDTAMDIRVLLVTGEFPPDVGGIASHVAELAQALAPRLPGLEVIHPRNLWRSAAEWSPHGVAVHRPGLVKGEPLYQSMLHSWLKRKLARAPVDILHVHGVRPLGATRGLRAKTVFTNHSSGFLARLRASPARKRHTARLLEHVDYLIGPSDELVGAARSFGYAGPAAMVSNGVDAKRFSPGPSTFRRAHGIGEQETVVLLARRLVGKNGVTDFAKAVGELDAKAVRIVIAGDGDQRAEMIRIFAEGRVLDRVLFLGAVPNTDMPPVYRAADISVLPSHAEATSISGLEAMATGLPLIGTRVGGIPAIIADGATGLLVEPRQPRAMAAALSRLIADREAQKEMGAAARQRVEREFSWPTIAQRTLDVYRSCLSMPVSSARVTAVTADT